MEGLSLSHWNFSSPDHVKQWDVEFVVKDKHFYAHRLILSVVCPYFETMFNGEFREKDQKAVRLKGVAPGTFEVFLHCVYPCGADPSKVSKELIIPLTEYAQFCQAQPLLEKCHKALENTHFGISNLDKLQVAVKTGGLKLIDRVIESLSAVEIHELNGSPIAEELEKTPSSLRKIIARSASLALAAQHATLQSVGHPCLTDWGAPGASW